MRRLLYTILPLILFGCDLGAAKEDGDFFNGGNEVSQGGSLARFSIVGDYLYIVNDFSLVPIDITSLDNPQTLETIELGIGIETIFPYGNNLFIGSSSAVYIYNISNPANPIELSTYWHATGCDPVVVSGDYAYVTLREGFSCNTTIELNVLEVVNVSDPRNPFQVAEIPMSNPRGLGLGCNNKLFVCEGPGGIVQFDISDPALPVYERAYTDYHANDVIIRDDLLITTGEDGIYQYRCVGDSLQRLSYIPYSL